MSCDASTPGRPHPEHCRDKRGRHAAESGGKERLSPAGQHADVRTHACRSRDALESPYGATSEGAFTGSPHADGARVPPWATSSASAPAIGDRAMPDRPDDDACRLDCVEHSIVAHAGRPQPFQATDQLLSRDLRLSADQGERFEHGVANRLRKRLQVVACASRQAWLRQARARVSPRPGSTPGPPGRLLRSRAAPGAPHRHRVPPASRPTPRTRRSRALLRRGDHCE